MTADKNQEKNMQAVLAAIDFSRIGTISRLKPSTSNIPPNTQQKEYLRRHAAESMILLQIAGMYLKARANRLVFSEDDKQTIDLYLAMETPLDSSVLSLDEISQLERLLTKIGLKIDLTEHQRTLFGIPVSTQPCRQGTIQIEYPNDLTTILSPRSIEDADEILRRGRIYDNFALAFFYLMDQRVLLEGERERGRNIPRFLRLYASHVLNDMLFSYFREFLHAFRFLESAGIPSDQITLPMLGERIKEMRK